MLMNMRLSSKLILGFAFPLFMFLAISMGSYGMLLIIKANIKRGQEKSTENFNIIEHNLTAYYEAAQTMAKAYIESGASEGNKYSESFDKAAAGLANVLDPYIEEQTVKAKAYSKTKISTLEKFIVGIFITTLVVIFIGVLISWLIIRSITKPLKFTIEGLNQVANQVTAASAQDASAGQLLARGASVQASSLEKSRASLEEMSTMTKQNADNADVAKNIMDESGMTLDKVKIHMGEMTEAIQEIARSSDETNKILKTIDEIAFQTNLLALNAAVEAARAGETGAGFAVVADEVRNLAMRSAEAAKNTSALIDKTIRAVENGNRITESTTNAFKENMDISRNVADLVGGIAAASSEQSNGIDLVSSAVSEMDKVTQQNASSAEESASASEELNAEAEHMKSLAKNLAVMISGGKGGTTLSMQKRTYNVPSRYGVSALPVKSTNDPFMYQNKETEDIHSF